MPSDRAVALAVVAATLAVAAPARSELRLGGAVGFGLDAQRVPGAFRWDVDSGRADSLLAVLHLGASSGVLTGFVAVATGVERERTERVALREAAVAATWRRAGGDSTAVRAFVDQPGSLWLDHPLAPPLGAVAETRAAGGRAEASWRVLRATAIAVERRGDDDEALGSAWLARLGADAPARLRAGLTWSHQVPAAADLPFEPRRRDVVGFDVSGAWRQSTAAVAYTETHAAFATAADEARREPGLRRAFRFDRSRRLTDILPSRAALRAELRLRAVPLGRWGRWGAAPSYRALGAHYTDPLAAAERDFAAPRRGLEGPRFETWFQPAAWPGWLRWVYDRHVTFRDTDRRVIAQELEAQAWVTPAVRLRAAYLQRDVRAHDAGRREHHDDLVGEIVAEERGARLRLQAARIDLDTEAARTVGALEAGTRIAGRLQAGMRLTVAVQAAAVRRGAFVVVRYFHLPQFEVAAQYGSDTVGDGTEPALDADLTGAGVLDDHVRLLVRGWF
jgi:hypothetical protein